MSDTNTTIVTSDQMRVAKHFGDGIGVDVYITRAKGGRVSDIDMDNLMDAVIDLMEARGYCMGGGWRLTTDEEEERMMEEE